MVASGSGERRMISRKGSQGDLNFYVVFYVLSQGKYFDIKLMVLLLMYVWKFYPVFSGVYKYMRKFKLIFII